MRYLSIYKSPERNAPPSQEEMERMGRYIEESMKKGVLISTEGCLPSALGARVRRADGKTTVIDGPFTEAKELIAGYTLIQVKSREEALEWTKRFPNPVGEGAQAKIEVRQLFELEDFGPSDAVKRFRDIEARKK